MTDIKNPRLIYFKGFLFLVGGCLAAGLLLFHSPSLKIAALLAISVWCFSRFYYFAFYVIQHYVDDNYRFAGLFSFFAYAMRQCFARERPPAETEWGCAAIGRAGDVSIDVDQAISGGERWELSIDCPRFHLRFSIPAPSTVAQFRDFLTRHLDQPTSGDLVVGTFGDSSVSIIKDDEFGDRFFLVVSACDGSLRHTLIGDDVPDFIAALAQANSGLDD